MIEPGQKVRVYFNLHRKCLSVQDAKSRRVIAHVPHISLINIRFKVSEAGRQRVLREKKKNVHAFVEGTVPHVNEFSAYPDVVTYNPYKYDSFVRMPHGMLKADPIPVTIAAAAHIEGRVIIANCAC